MPDLLLDHPSPDFDGLVRILQGDTPPDRVPIVEIAIDHEVLRSIQESLLGKSSAMPLGVYWPSVPDSHYYQELINIYYRLGYDFVPLCPLWINNPPGKIIQVADTAEASRGLREWVDESGALIRSWEDFERFPWDRIYAAPETLEMAGHSMPEGMKATVSASLFEHVIEAVLGFKGLFSLMRADPQLVEAVFNSCGQLVYKYYQSAVECDVVGAIFHADDIGFRTGTMISPADLRCLLFPWLAKYAALAHEHGKPFWIHSCGNLYRNSPSVMDDLIEMVKIDGFHSFQDVILPVGAVKARYGNRIALMGGADVDKLATLPEDELRNYLRAILEACMPGGRFAFGSGNSIANYIPLKNYAILLDEARRFRP
jgi:uroporphyrinogen decarboxylase